MDKITPLVFQKPITLAKFLKELALQDSAEISAIPLEELINTKRPSKKIEVTDKTGNAIYDTDLTGNLISDFELFECLDENVKEARKTEDGNTVIFEIFLD